ncbi:DNA cytosine methyltransferase [Vibrio cholerae]|uniref:DNA cytosine methyltransferase n=1 Tax=Vibrio cholerae TaxID=666 RepID=UPI00155EA4A1|nr:DNA cytosine methyltransferase [Vibrio cholerae]EGR1834718.1 DNA cytosine methyltransferase [Vibrio cholerae]EGR2469231.1 DNA cytosine methyltransferase [Vibrio cholerae]EKF6711463.1 DNA cytosine methyltransferase [Vibrio cholerae]ELJ8662889.1 DNA cytosine methyltransferase [Vibrio cholerae]MCR9971184.1 DNA cytosine methyltransferase [Vibrio cholerae]
MFDAKAIDLFCGAGGLTHGLQRAGIKVVAGYDIEAQCRYAYEKNNDAVFIQKSVTDIKPEELEHHYGDSPIRILAGCAPCQLFSSYNKKSKEENQKDERWSLLTSFGEHIKSVKPEIVTMENVPRLVNHRVFHDFIDMLYSEGYKVSFKVVYCPDYGMPQSRSRLVLLASLLGDISLIDPTHNKENYLTLRDAIGHLPKLSAGEIHPLDTLHRAAALSEVNMKRMLASTPGGTWKDWPEHLIAQCHKKSTGSSYLGVYGRMSWDKVSSTITTQCIGFGNGRFGHPEQHRAITLREAAIIQTFPDDYSFWPEHLKLEMRPVAKMIGNAVPVRLGEVVGKSIHKHLLEKNNNGEQNVRRL